MASNPLTLPGNVVAILLQKLGHDDDFRALFIANTVEALRQVGAPEPDRCAHCLRVTKLADKETIRSSNVALTAQLTSVLALMPIHLNAK